MAIFHDYDYLEFLCLPKVEGWWVLVCKTNNQHNHHHNNNPTKQTNNSHTSYLFLCMSSHTFIANLFMIRAVALGLQPAPPRQFLPRADCLQDKVASVAMLSVVGQWVFPKQMSTTSPALLFLLAGTRQDKLSLIRKASLPGPSH